MNAITRRELMLSATCATAIPAATRPNVILFLADDLGWKDLGFQGSEGRTPNLDAMCQQGVRFDQLYAFPLCSPTRSALMTGRNPVRFGLGYTVVRPWSTYGVPPREKMMPMYFREAGYQTAMVGKWHLGHANVAHLPRSRGFDHFHGHLNGAIDYFTHERDGGIDWQRNGVSVREQGYTTDLVAAEAGRWIAARDRTRPFFLYVPTNAPHTPLQAPPDLVAKYAHIENPKRRTYLAMVEALDRAVGRVMERVRLEGLERDTLVLFLSDNGGARGAGADNGPLRAGKSNVFEGGIRVPGLAYWPGRLKPSVCSQLLTVYDLLPTLGAACGMELNAPQPLDGANFWPAIEGGAAPRPRKNLLFAVQPDTGPRQHALRDGAWKLVRIDGAGESLFNIAEDPHEKRDRLADNPAEAARLRAMMDAWIKLAPAGEASYSLQPHPGWITPKDWAKVAVE